METIHDLRAKLDAYRLQLTQVVTILVSDPENAQFRQLKTDLDTVIKLTEELVKTKEETDGIGASSEPAIVSGQHGSSNNDRTTSAAADADNTTRNAPFQVGQIVEAISGDRPYAAVVTAVSPEAGECTLKYFEFETAVVLPFTEIAKISNGSLSSAQVAPGFVGQVKYAADQRWYDATVDRVTEHGYHVIYSAYGNSEEVPLQYIRAPLLKKERPKDENALIAIPDNLKVKPTDTEEVRHSCYMYWVYFLSFCTFCGVGESSQEKEN